MRWALPFLILTLLLPLSGCADKPARLARRPKVYRKIISLSPGTSEIVASDADATTLKGRTAACNFPQNMMASIPIVASIKPDYEKIQSLKPDMILYDKGDPTAALQTLAPWVRQLHVKDARRRKIPGTWGREVTVGKGDVDWRAFFSTFKHVVFNVNLVIEREQGDQRVADIRAARKVVERTCF